MINIKFDEPAFRREIEKQAQSAMNDMARGMTRDFDRLRAQYQGRPVAEIKPAVKRIFAKDGGSISDTEAAEYAQMISDGTKITFNPDRIRL